MQLISPDCGGPHYLHHPHTTRHRGQKGEGWDSIDRVGLRGVKIIHMASFFMVLMPKKQSPTLSNQSVSVPEGRAADIPVGGGAGAGGQGSPRPEQHRAE